MDDAGSNEDQPQGQERKGKQPSRGEVSVFENWCKGCGLCIAFCPQQVFEANGEGRSIVVHPERCTACEWCYLHCPDFAIVVTRVDDKGRGGAE